MRPKISVIVPVYNGEMYLKRCVESLLQQTLYNIQIILVDDGSTDGSGRLCDEYGKMDSRVLVIHKENQGAGLARNSGMEAAEGEYIGFVDADDYVDETMYEALYQGAIAHDADIAMTGARFIGGSLFEAGGKEEKRYCFDKYHLFEMGAEIKELLLGTVGALPQEPEDTKYGFCVWKNIYRRDLIFENGLAFESEREFISEDMLFLIDFFRYAGRAVGVPGAHYYYLRNSFSFSKSYREERFEQSKKMLGEICRRLSLTMAREDFLLYVDRYFQSSVRIAVTQEIQYASAGGMTAGELKERLCQICHDEEVVKVLKRYPYWKLPLKQAIFAFSVRFRLTGLQRLLVHIRKNV